LTGERLNHPTNNPPAWPASARIILNSVAAKNATVDLTEYVRSLESDLTYVREKLAMLEAGTLQEGVRKPGMEWADNSASTIPLYEDCPDIRGVLD
jgi:hypothetical protein